jgi:hypothetical protein
VSAYRLLTELTRKPAKHRGLTNYQTARDAISQLLESLSTSISELITSVWPPDDAPRLLEAALTRRDAPLRTLNPTQQAELATLVIKARDKAKREAEGRLGKANKDFQARSDVARLKILAEAEKQRIDVENDNKHRESAVARFQTLPRWGFEARALRIAAMPSGNCRVCRSAVRGERGRRPSGLLVGPLPNCASSPTNRLCHRRRLRT